MGNNIKYKSLAVYYFWCIHGRTRDKYKKVWPCYLLYCVLIDNFNMFSFVEIG